MELSKEWDKVRSYKNNTEIASATGYGRGYIKEGGNNILFSTVTKPLLAN